VLQTSLHFQRCTCFLFCSHVSSQYPPNRDQAYVDSFRTLLTFSLTVRDEIAREGSNTAKIGTLLETARGDTRRSQASGIKKSIGDWHVFSPGLSKTGLRGWDHSECARLLCPPSIEWNAACVFFLSSHSPSHSIIGTRRSYATQSHARSLSLVPRNFRDSSGRERWWTTQTQLSGSCVTRSCSP